MIDNVPLLDYREVFDRLGPGRSHLLLGNGFSIACDPVFGYHSLYDAAIQAGLSHRATHVFDRLGTNNFEGAMRLLEDAHWVAGAYGLVHSDESPMLGDLEVIKDALVEAIAHAHLEHSGLVSDDRKLHAGRFLAPYHNVFCTSYDLLTSWINMSAGTPPPFDDGFHADPHEPGARTLRFTEHQGARRGLFFLHGAFHLFVRDGAIRKHNWVREGRRLTDLLRDGLARGDYPLFVAEGTAAHKLEQIRRNGYLAYCLGKLGRIKHTLVVHGHALGSSDRHIADAIADNLEIDHLYVGLFGGADSAANQATRHAADHIRARRAERAHGPRREEQLAVAFYRSESAAVWDGSGAELGAPPATAGEHARSSLLP
jgi:hypothetical protein